MKEVIELPNENEELAVVLTIKTNRHPNGISYVRQDCVNKQFLDLDNILKDLRDTLRAKKIII